MKRKRETPPKPAVDAARADYWRYLLPAAAIAVMVLAYSNSFEGLFLMDNAEMIRDTRIHAATSEQLHRILTQRYWQGIGDQLYRPFTTLTYLFNYSILGNGTNPAGYHWFNLMLHSVNLLLVYWLGLAVFKRPAPAALLSGLWGLHPALVESVTNVIGRSDMLAAFGVLGALAAHRKAARSEGATKALWLTAVFLASAVGVFSKESGVVVIAVVVLWDVALEADGAWRLRGASYAAAALPCVLYLWARAQALANDPL